MTGYIQSGRDREESNTTTELWPEQQEGLNKFTTTHIGKATRGSYLERKNHDFGFRKTEFEMLYETSKWRF